MKKAGYTTSSSAVYEYMDHLEAEALVQVAPVNTQLGLCLKSLCLRGAKTGNRKTQLVSSLDRVTELIRQPDRITELIQHSIMVTELIGHPNRVLKFGQPN